MARPDGSNAAAMLHAMSDRMSLAGIPCPEETIRFWVSGTSAVCHSAPTCSNSKKSVVDVPASSAMAGELKLCRRKICKDSMAIHQQPNRWLDWLESINVMLDASSELDCDDSDDTMHARRAARLAVLQSKLTSNDCVVHSDNAEVRTRLLDRISVQLGSLTRQDPHGFLESVWAGERLDIRYGIDDKIKSWSPKLEKVLRSAASNGSFYYSRIPAEVAAIVRGLSDSLSEGCCAADAKTHAMADIAEYVATLGVSDMCVQASMPDTCRFYGGDFSHPNDWAFAEWSAEVIDCLETMIDKALKFAFSGFRRGKLQLVAMDSRLEHYQISADSWSSRRDSARDGARKTVALVGASRIAFPELFAEGDVWMFAAVPAGTAKKFAEFASADSTRVEILPGGVRNVTPQLLQCALGLISRDDFSSLSSPAAALSAARLVLQPR